MKTGVIGLGAMGANMARRLAGAGHLQTVFNRTRAKAEALAEACGCGHAGSPAELAEQCELILICVSRDQDVLEMINAIKARIRPGAIVVDTSTVSADTARRAAALLAEHEAAFLDGPVSGGVEGARRGSLAMMVGGDAEILARARPALDAIAANIAHIGPTGSGQASKAVNQIMVAGVNQAVTEALAFGRGMGLPMDKVVDIIAGGAANERALAGAGAGNWFLEHRGKTMLAGTYEPGFKLALHHKDLEICRAMARSLSENTLPIIEMTLSHYQKLMEEGHGDEDISALFRLKQKNLS